MRVAVLLALLTLASVLGVRLVAVGQGVGDALAFALGLGAILGAHEAGHILVARRRGFRLGLPWFVPVPVFVGTLGAVIRMRELPPSRGALLAMGAAGPLAGFAAILPIALLADPSGGEPLPRPLVLWIVDGLLARPAVGVGDPFGFAAWVGCLLTAINLLPAGQLDGGHIAAALWPRARERARLLTVAGLLLAGLWWWPWLLLAIAIALFATPLERVAPGRLDRAEKLLALGGALVFALCALPAPLPLP